MHEIFVCLSFERSDSNVSCPRRAFFRIRNELQSIANSRDEKFVKCTVWIWSSHLRANPSVVLFALGSKNDMTCVPSGARISQKAKFCLNSPWISSGNVSRSNGSKSEAAAVKTATGKTLSLVIMAKKVITDMFVAYPSILSCSFSTWVCFLFLEISTHARFFRQHRRRPSNGELLRTWRKSWTANRAVTFRCRTFLVFGLQATPVVNVEGSRSS